MDSMLDLEELRHSIIEQDIPSSIGQVNQWIDTHGLTMLESNQRLPFNYEEAEMIRKEHEKIELKCMTFLAFYAKINLKNIPEQYQEVREDMDIKIHKFSEHIKARRHIVVSFYTFFRHIEKLQEKLADVQNEDLSNLPDSIEEINILIKNFSQSLNNCLKRLSHLKVEADRVKTSLNTIVALNNSPSFDYIDRAGIIESKEHIDTLLQETEEDVTRIFEIQRILELELKIEAKMMIIEDDINRCCGWLQKMEQKLVDKYNDKIVGMATVENDILYHDSEELVNKMKATKDYGEKLIRMYEQLCLQFKRDNSRGNTGKEKLDELWELGDLITTEALSRLAKAGILFHGLDSTLDKVEDMLLSINKDKESNVTKEEIVEKYRGVRNEAYEELKVMKQSANGLLSKLRYDLFNNKIKPQNGVYLESEPTEDMIKMKIFTIVVKLKELDRCITNDEDPEMISQSYSEPVFGELPDDGHLENIDKYIKFLNTTRLNWDSKPLPVSLSQAVKALQEHRDISKQSEQYWRNIQTALGSKGYKSKNENPSEQKLLTMATNEKNNWDENWTSHLDEQLNPRYQFLKRLQDFNNDIDLNQVTLDELIDRPDHSLELVRELKKDLAQMRNKIPKKEKSLDKLYQDATNIHQTDFNDALSVSEDKLIKYRNRLDNFIELENIIEEILEFLPRLSPFKKEWPSRVKKHRNNPTEISNLKSEAKDMKSEIARFDTDQLRELATVTHGNSKRVEWLIDELRADFTLPNKSDVHEEYVASNSKPLMATFDGPSKEVSVNAIVHTPTELKFEMDSLPRDQYNIQWYKNNASIDPDSDQRITTVCEPRKGRLNFRIEKCDYSDAGKYWCEVNDVANGVLTSYPINLTVSPKKPSPLETVEALFKEHIFAGRDDPLTLELKLGGYRFAPEIDMMHKNKMITVNQRDCPWSRVSSNESIEFSHPAITDSDRGKYEFVIAGQMVSKTEIAVGDAPKLFQHHFKETVKATEPVSITIPTVDIANKADQKVVWRKDGVTLSPESGKFSWRMNRNGDPVFEIAQVRPVHAGIYTCEVFNDYGRTSAQFVLDVINDVKQSPTKSSEAKGGSTVEDVFANVGESVTLAIDYVADKQSEIVWTKEGKPITGTDPRIKIINESNSRCVLHLNSARVTDSGLFSATVKGTNRKHSVNLEVIPPAPGPMIEKYPQNVRVKVNEPLSIECIIRSTPSCDNIKWTLNPLDGGIPKNIVSNFKCKLTTNSDGNPSENLQRAQLYIDRASRADAGEYVLRCENSVGWSSVKIPVTVIDDAQNKKKSPTFVQSPKKEVVTHGDEPVVLKCKVTGNPFPTVKWMKNGRDVIVSDFIKTRNMGEMHELSILNPRAHDSGTYEAIASNSEGTEKCQCQLKVVDPKEFPVSEEVAVPKHIANNQASPDDFNGVEQIPQRTQLIFSNTVVRSPPQFVTTFTDQIVQEGEDVDLKCCLIGQPEPLVYWSYNTHILKNPRFETTRQLDEYTLSMRNLREEDSGRYSMTAENSSGLATCSALVIVDKNNEIGKTLDRSQYKTNSKPMTAEKHSNPFTCHTTLSHSMSPSLSDESRIMQVSPRAAHDDKLSPSYNSPHHHSKLPEIEIKPSDNLNFTKSKTKTIKTYHYSGPSGVDLPGIGFIPKTQISSALSSTSSDENVNRAVFVSGTNQRLPDPPARNPFPDNSRFSYVESSDCDYPL